MRWVNSMQIGWKDKLIRNLKNILRLGAVMIFSASLITYIFHVVEFNKFYVTERPENGITLGQPFAKGTGGSEMFRIPGIVTLDNGNVIAVTDARWDHGLDSSGLDTIVSVSEDDGATWQYTFANYFGDNGNVRNDASTCFIDPAIATDGNTAYMIVDVNPSGFALSSSFYAPIAGKNGFDDQNRLLLRSKDSVKVPFGGLSYGLACHNAKYEYYLDYTDSTRSAYGIFDRNSGERVEGYEVDLYFNITYTDKGNTVTTNLFYHTSPFQVYPTAYLYLTTTTDGLNWSAPTLLNLKREEERCLLLGPGNGVYDDNTDRLIFTAYVHKDNTEEWASLIWKDGQGNWHRSEHATVNSKSSEATAVILENGKVRMFYRDNEEVLRYTDFVYDETRDNYFRDPSATEVRTSAVKTANCQLNAISYSGRIDGKQVIFVSTATGKDRKRVDGHIYTFVVERDGSLVLINDYKVTEDAFSYSCMTELAGGNIGLIYESDFVGGMTYVKIEVDKLT